MKTCSKYCLVHMKQRWQFIRIGKDLYLIYLSLQHHAPPCKCSALTLWREHPSKSGLVWANPQLFHIRSGQKGRIVLNGIIGILGKLFQASVLSENRVKTRSQIDLILSHGYGFWEHGFFLFELMIAIALTIQNDFGINKNHHHAIELVWSNKNHQGHPLCFGFFVGNRKAYSSSSWSGLRSPSSGPVPSALVCAAGTQGLMGRVVWPTG